MLSQGTEQSPLSFDKNDIVFGLPTDYWLQAYWELFYVNDFARSIPAVYCLPTNDEGIDPPKWDYKIKKKKAILIPPGKLKVGIANKRFKEEDGKAMVDRVMAGMDAFSDFNVFLDGELVSNECFRHRSDLFEWRRKIDNRFYKVMMIVDAYWLFIKPNVLDEGMHHINTYIACSMEQTKISLNYNLTITA